MPRDPLGAALPGRLCGPTTLSQPGYAPVCDSLVTFVSTKLSPASMRAGLLTPELTFVTKCRQVNLVAY